MNEVILPFSWHSFCISLDPFTRLMKFYHNDHLQAEQNFTMTNGNKLGISKLLGKGHLGGKKFVGFITDFQMFGSALSEEDIFGWTACQIQVRHRSIQYK